MTIPAPSVISQADAPINAPGYAVAPNAVIRDTRLSPTARLLYVVLDGRRAGNRDRGIRVSIAVLAADMGCAESTVRRVAGELEVAGLLQRRRTGRTSSWQLDNPVRMGRRLAAIEKSLDPRSAVATDRDGTDGTGADPHARSPISAPSDRSSASALQSITREDYNNSADLVPSGAAFGGPRDESQRTGGSSASNQASPTRASTGAQQPAQTAGPAGQPAGDSKAAQSKAAPVGRDITATYLAQINAATGADLRPTRQLRELVQKISARGIPAPEAALTAAAWLAVKGGSVTKPEGFLAAIVLPSMAQGQELDTSPPKPTPGPPAYRELVAQELCDHGAEQGRCALCRRTATSPPPAPAQQEPGAFARSQKDNYRRAMERSYRENPPPWIVEAEERRQPPPWAVAPDGEELSRCQHGQRLGTPCHACDPLLPDAPTASEYLSAALAKLGAPR